VDAHGGGEVPKDLLTLKSPLSDSRI
jgi:hypothetical protein